MPPVWLAALVLTKRGEDLLVGALCVSRIQLAQLGAQVVVTTK